MATMSLARVIRSCFSLWGSVCVKGRVSLKESIREVHLVRELILYNFRLATVCGLGLRICYKSIGTHFFNHCRGILAEVINPATIKATNEPVPSNKECALSGHPVDVHTFK